METIRKKVNLEDARIRLAGCTVPSISGSEDSLAKIYKDISGSKYIRIKKVAKTYNSLLNIVRSGLKLKRKTNLSNCAGSGSENKYVVTEEFEINQISCQSIVYGVYDVNSFIKVNDTEYETYLPISNQYIVLVSDYDEFNALGGTSKILECYQYLFCGRTDGGSYVTPYIDIPILLTQDIQDIGHMTDYQDNLNDFPNEDGISVDTKFSNNIPNPLAERRESASGYTTDSKLQFVRSGTIYTDDNGNLLPGLFVEDGKLWLYRYDGTKWSHSNQPASFNGKTCGDGLSNGECKNANVYRTASLDATVQEVLSGASTNDYYYFYVKYKNDESNPMTIPFVESDTVHINTTSNPGFITINYTYNEIPYKETYKYNTGQTMTVPLDGFENIEIYYNEIDYEFTEETIYNKQYELYREGNIAEISEYIVADVWGRYDYENTINAPVFKEEYLLGVSSAFESEVDVSVNRGNAAAFERHFKLSECNTLEDLENYSNNIFNL